MNFQSSIASLAKMPLVAARANLRPRYGHAAAVAIPFLKPEPQRRGSQRSQPRQHQQGLIARWVGARGGLKRP